MEILDILGIVCALVALGVFIGNQYNYLKNDGFWYDALNFVSALGLAYYAYETGATPFLLTNTVWAVISGLDVAKHPLGIKKKRVRALHLRH